jgi:SAM-dependent methyltransferase
MGTLVSMDASVYYSGQYWNDFPPVIEYISENITGNPQKWWVQDFKERFCEVPFSRGLFLNCGNGWVEREFIDYGMVHHAIGFDYSQELLLQAKELKSNRAISYFRADVNRIHLPDDSFDLIVNVAALHHVQYINRLCRVLCRTLTKDGIFVNFDYVGPHRNQYSLRHMRLMQKVNRSLPKHIRKDNLRWAHLPTMLNVDPTEAIHSELIFTAVYQYFNVFERHDVGGGIAYEILTHNDKLSEISADDLFPYIRRILEIDKEYTTRGKVPNLFSYFLARPNKTVLGDINKLERLQRCESFRESWAEKLGGVYTISDFFGIKFHAFVRQLNRYRNL